LVVALAAAGCGSKSSSSTSVTPATTTTVHFAKTKFVFHTALAFGAFHHFIYEPIKAGDLRHPLLHKFTLVKMGLAGLFVYHELKLAAQDVRASKLLSTLFAPLIALDNKVKALGASIGAGHATSASADSLNSDVASLSSAAASKGQSISEAVPSTSQLATGVAP